MNRHFTATAFVIDDRKRCLLLWHKRLQRWMPPGGHVEENEMPEETAKRECKEETGLDVEILTEEQQDLFMGFPQEGRMLKKPVNMLLEEIPATGDQPAHQHMDFLFVARPLNLKQKLILAEEEGRELKWFTIDDIKKLPRTEIFANVQAYVMALLS